MLNENGYIYYNQMCLMQLTREMMQCDKQMMQCVKIPQIDDWALTSVQYNL